ncbi:hypothetical protein LTR56_026287 [Elasticomyces elasticus]|nr:hypothetical protein LTR22_028254 [Elasticomyces elasticus]KAK3615943.1 hypothetical protein LTR56_026287 [Elasticomyces elasticus]KAK4895080.1 hypothetical protein LTR49_028308 [Elasticomyces elasticus]KAK5736081.1 hypothetical protein LTS12_026291 [Elasticomyces elasticus]
MDRLFKVLDVVDEATRAATAQAKINLRSFLESEGVIAALPGWVAKLIRKAGISFETVFATLGDRLSYAVVRAVGRAAVFAGEVILILAPAVILLRHTIWICHRTWLRYTKWRMKITEQRAYDE